MLSYYYAKFKENPCVGTDVSTPFPICFCQKGANLHFFYKFDKSEFISELVSRDKSVFLCFNATQE